MKFKIEFFFYFLILISISAQAQQEDPHYYSEKFIGINLHTNSGFIGGLAGKYSKKASENTLNTISVEIVGVKDNQEVKVETLTTGNSFILGKQNYFYVIRPSLSKDLIVFAPARDEGVQINTSFGGGFSLGVLKPYHIKYDYSPNMDMVDVRDEGYNPAIHNNEFRILGHGSYLNGWGNSKIAPGFHLKTSATFYLGNSARRVTGVEAGLITEAFFRVRNGSFQTYSINLVPFTKNKWLFTALYLNIFYAWRN